MSESGQVNTAEILEVRAKILAAEPTQELDQGSVLEVVKFMLAEESYAIEAAFVQEVFPLKDFTPVPCTPPFILGIINVRGEILTVINLKKFFDLPEKGITELNKVVIIQTPVMRLGILADAVTHVTTVALGQMETSLPSLTGVRGEYLKGLTSDRLVILDVERITGDSKILVDEKITVVSGSALKGAGDR